MSELEFRAASITDAQVRDFGDDRILTGHASTVEQSYSWGGQSWAELIKRGTFTRALADSPRVVLLINHDRRSLPLASTDSNTLRLSEDQTGLAVRASLDPADPEVASLASKMSRQRLQMSFSFRVPPGGEKWDDAGTVRSIHELSLAGGDVSIVTTPANTATDASLRGALSGRARMTPLDDMLAIRIRLQHSRDKDHEFDRLSRLQPSGGEDRGPTADWLRDRFRARGCPE